MKTLRFGIEIETVGATRQQLAYAIQSAVGGHASGDYRGWQLTTPRAASGRWWRTPR